MRADLQSLDASALSWRVAAAASMREDLLTVVSPLANLYALAVTRQAFRP